MIPEPSPRARELLERLRDFMAREIVPAEAQYEAELEPIRRSGIPWRSPAIMESLKAKARAAGLWNLFLPHSTLGAGLNNRDYAPLCEEMGRSPIAPEACNCSAPDTGNMEVLDRYGTPEQKNRWLEPLLAGEIRSGFAMTEPDVASSDATNIESRIERRGGDYVLNGRKWWCSGAADARCRILIFMGKTDPANPDRHRQQSMILVPIETPGVKVVRSLGVFGYDDAPHGHAEIHFTDVNVPASNLLVGEGEGFAIAQGRLGPGRIHHCMRAIGLAERALELMCRRVESRTTFGQRLSEQSVMLERIATARIEIDQSRLLVLHAAHLIDTVGAKAALKAIGMIKVAVPDMACRVIDWAIQAHGGAGVCKDFPLAAGYAHARTLRIVDGPDEVHRNQIARLELRGQRR